MEDHLWCVFLLPPVSASASGVGAGAVPEGPAISSRVKKKPHQR